MPANRCTCPQQPIMRTEAIALPHLPDEIIAKIIDNVTPTEIVALGWDRVSRAFSALVHRSICSKQYFCVAHDLIWKLYLASVSNNCREKFDKLLVLLIKKYLCEVNDLTIPVTLFSHIQRILVKHPWLAATSGTACQFRHPQPGVAFTHLTRLTIQIGSDFGSLTLSHNFENLKTSSSLCKTLSEINLDLILSDREDVTCSGFRELLLFLKEIACDSTMWNVRLSDDTNCGQGWRDPSKLSTYRNKLFICYIRAMLELNMRINQLVLIDRRKVSPYMLMSSTRRTIYMFPEFKKCHQLCVCYDIGLIAPTFSHENDRFEDLVVFEVDESHVLYKADLLEYLKTATKLESLRVVVPSTWSSRVSRCTKGCFQNPDYSCFKLDGWCNVFAKLPKAHFEIVENEAPVACI
ncbi:unnamed protein product [Caenorhabditis bovis]|uniref:F-box domain-containing protein n=1 Tax=Caenorhabditis bovis TaxID=2654633 RepID=A0A8S1ETV5_9PELO|nr:unnamed protein product [Caenorhabditis bovis]